MRNRASPIDVFLLPGGVFVGTEGHRIRTLLASCVSIILWHPRRRVGAMSHFVLSARGHGHAGRALDGRYGEEAMLLMLDALDRRRVPACECEGKIFGGGTMAVRLPDGATDVGRRNGEAARRLLRAHGIELVAESLFGQGHRQVIFDVRTGAVWARQVPPSDAPARMLQ